jgi:RimJ/RimL family protein N-acetyltransferase
MMDDRTMTLRSARIILRELALEDWPAVQAYASRIEVCRYQPWGPNTPEETRCFVVDAMASAAEHPRRRYALAVTLTPDGRVIGLAEMNVRDARSGSGEISYVLHPDHWGQGIATEAAGLLLRFGFAELGLHRIFATCDPRNVASARVMEKNGLQYEGRLREALRIRDGWRDSLVYAILEPEWRAAVAGDIRPRE